MKSKLMSILLAAICLLASASLVMAQTPAATPVASSGTAAIYLQVRNDGSAADRLVGGTTDAAQDVQIATMEVVNGVMTRTAIDGGLEIPAGGAVSFDPAGYHLVLVNLTHGLNDGDVVEVTLTFEHAGEVVVPVRVQANAPIDSSPVAVGEITIDLAWARPVALQDDCGCGIPDSVKKMIPAATPAS